MKSSYLLKLIEWVLETPGAIIEKDNTQRAVKAKMLPNGKGRVKMPIGARLMEPEDVAELPDSVAIKLLKDLGLIKPLTDELRAKLTELMEMLNLVEDDAPVVIDFLRVQTGATPDQIIEFYEEYFRSDTRVGSWGGQNDM